MDVAGQFLAPVLIAVAATALGFALKANVVIRLAVFAVGIGLAVAASPIAPNMAATTPPKPTVALDRPIAPPDTPDRRSFTYRVTLAALVDGAMQEASSLQRVTIMRNITFGLGSMSTTNVRYYGEAVALPIEGSRYLLAAMSGQRSQNDYEMLLASPCRPLVTKDSSGPASADAYFAAAPALGQSCQISLDRLPLLVALESNPANPSARYLQTDDLGAGFDRDVSFVSLTVTRVDEPLQRRLTALEPLVAGLWALRPPRELRIVGVDRIISLSPDAIQNGNLPP